MQPAPPQLHHNLSLLIKHSSRSSKNPMEYQTIKTIHKDWSAILEQRHIRLTRKMKIKKRRYRRVQAALSMKIYFLLLVIILLNIFRNCKNWIIQKVNSKTKPIWSKDLEIANIFGNIRLKRYLLIPNIFRKNHNKNILKYILKKYKKITRFY